MCETVGSSEKNEPLTSISGHDPDPTSISGGMTDGVQILISNKIEIKN